MAAMCSIDRSTFIKLPMAERRQILAAQAEAMVEHYEQDAAWREWVNFDVETVYNEFCVRTDEDISSPSNRGNL
jgi:hypothetical protein